MTPGKVTVGYLHPGEVKACFALSLSEMLLYDCFHEGRMMHPMGEMALETHASAIADGRNQLAAVMLSEQSESEWLFVVDADMGYAANTVDLLIEAADPETRPIVGGLAFAHKSDGNGPFHARRYRPAPTVYRMWETDDDLGFVPMFDYPRNELVECDATGMACVLIHRSVFQRMRDKHGDRWFDVIEVEKGPKRKKFGEDLSFCLRARALDIPVHVHTGVRTTHDKGGVFQDEDSYDDYRLLAQLRPAKQTIDVLIPTLGRPHRIAELVVNIREATVSQHRTVFVVESHDQATIDACLAVGAEHVVNERAANYGGAINTGFAHTSGDWVFTGADDLHFTHGWDRLCLAAARDWFTVVGTNDKLNRRVTNGFHSTHSLVKRSWLESDGGVLDEGPGSFLPEHYDHNFVDHEFVSSAKMRGRFTPCLHAVVAHHHHLNGMAPLDATYEKSSDLTLWDKDQRTFMSRAGLWAGL